MSTASPQIPSSESPPEGQILGPGHNFSTITEKISSIVQTKPSPRGWWVGFLIGFLLVMALFNTMAMLLLKGIGVWV
ncbi:MAG: hypothetical protein ACKO23_14070 [Gemmataceae bacterium]